MFFLVAKINNQYVNYYLVNDILRDNVWSALRLTLENPKLVPLGSSINPSLYEENQADIQIKRDYWGAFQTVKISATHPRSSSSMCFLLGDDFKRTDPTALYFVDNNRYLSVSGKTQIIGDAYLPNSGFRVVSVGGVGFSGKTPVTGTLKLSGNKLPDPDSKYIRYLDLTFNHNTYDKDYVHTFEQALLKGKMVNSFANPTMHIVSNNAIFFDSGFALDGNIIVKSNKKITIDKNAQLNNVLLLSPSIEIMDGYKGSNQFFASDSLVVGKNVKLVYPGYIGLYNTTQKPCSLWVGKGSVIEGGAFAYQKRQVTNSPYVLMDQGSHLIGQMYCNGQLEIKSNVTGSIYTNAFFLGGDNAEYNNLLLNVKIDFKGLPEDFSGFDIMGNSEKLKLISCLK